MKKTENSKTAQLVKNIPVSIAIIKDYKIKEIISFNCKNIRKFQAASISKILTSLLVLRLVEEKKLDLDKDVNGYLKNYKVINSRGKTTKVTLKQLLSHTAGVNVPGFPGYSLRTRIPSINQILRGEKPCNTDRIFVKYKPGKCHYSGGGYIIIQKVVEDSIGKFEDLAQTKIFNPLGLKNSDFRLRKISRRYPEKAAAGLWSTANDLGKLLIEMQLSYSGKSNKIISKRLMKKMLKPVQKAEGNFIGLGAFISKNQFFHTGHNYKFRSKLAGSLKSGNGFVYLANTDKDLVNRIMKRINRR